MFGVGWCVTLYTTVLALEFAPIVFERFRLEKPLKVAKALTIPLVIAGVLLSTLHQSSLGSLYLIVPRKLHPLWYSPLLPIFFYVSAIALGCAMRISLPLDAVVSVYRLAQAQLVSGRNNA